jgi:replication-associated recombination protein RarA
MHVPGDLPVWRREAELTDRRAERGVLDRLIEAVRAGESQALVLHGEGGVGKTALLEYLAAQALGCRVARAVSVQAVHCSAPTRLRPLAEARARRTPRPTPRCLSCP